jgi:hypothetical protein
MESDVTQTLGELERKLKELERELESVGRAGETDADPAQGGWTPLAPTQGPAEAPPPPAGVTPFTAAWHGSGPPQGATPPPPPPPPPAYNGAPAAVPVPPPTVGWAPAAAPPAYAAPPPPAPTAGLHHQLDELLAFRDRLVRSTNELVDELSRVLAELGADVAPAAPAPPPPRPPSPDEIVFSGPVTIEAGHFADLATLAAFEQAIARTYGVAEVAVRALDAGRATIDLTLAEPVPLGLALRQTAPVAFTLTVAGARLVHLTIGPAGPPG